MANTIDGAPGVPSNGTAKWLGVPVTMWVETFKTLGTSTIVLIFIGILVYQFVPDLVQGHLQFLKSTSESVQELKQPLADMQSAADEMAAAARDMQRGQDDSSAFFEQVREDHKAQAQREQQMLLDHKQAIQALTEIKTTVPPSGGG